MDHFLKIDRFQVEPIYAVDMKYTNITLKEFHFYYGMSKPSFFFSFITY